MMSLQSTSFAGLSNDTHGALIEAMENDVRKVRLAHVWRLVEKDFGGVVAKFAAAIDKSPTQVRAILHPDKAGGRPIGEKMARHIESALRLKPGSLDINSANENNAFGTTEAASTYEKSAIRTYESESDLGDNYVWIDRYDLNLSAGNGDLQWVVHEKDPIAFRARYFKAKKLDPKNCRALYVRGRSMEPHLEDGDTVLIDTSKTKPIDGEVFAVFYNDEYWIKRLSIVPGGLRLLSDNPNFQPIEIAGEKLGLVKIIGMKVWRGG